MIHASKIPDEQAMKKFNFDSLPMGCIVGKAELVDVKKYDNNEFESDKDLHLATDEWGYYGFILKNVQRVDEIPCNGKLGFWNFGGGS